MLGQGVSLAVLGGYGDLAANLVWIRMNAAWERRERLEVLAHIEMATALSPDAAFFWINGARIIANDMPIWVVGEARMDSLYESDSGRAVRRRYAARALAFLDKAPPVVSEGYPLLLERAILYWKQLEDLPAALDCLRRAIAAEGAPYYLSRVYAELLIRHGQAPEALAFLKAHFANLPDDDPTALKELVRYRIWELEQTLRSASEAVSP